MIENLCAIIPYRDEQGALRRLIKSLPSWLPFIVVDDCSDVPPPVEEIERHGGQVATMATRGYFSGAVNAGIAMADTDVLVLNQDTTLTPGDWWEELDALRREHAIIGDGVFDHPAWPRGYVQGTFMFMRRDAIQSVGLLDAEHWPLWGATAEWQLRACRKGFTAYPMRDCGWFQHERHGAYGASISKTLKEEPEQRGLLLRTPPLVSVVTACYNYGQYLPDLMASLTGGKTSFGDHPGQTFQGFELIICDDASTDGSWNVAQSLADDWRGIRAIRHGQNQGTAIALNTAIAASYGRYIMVMCADDMLAPEALERFMVALEAQPHSLVYSDQQLFARGKRGEIWHMQEYDFEELLERNQVPAGVMFTKQAWREVGGYPPAFARGREDWAWAVRMGEHGYCGIRVAEPLYLYRREGQNRSLRNAGERPQFVQQMHETFPDLYRGERPMGCCGGRRSLNVKAASTKGAATALPRVGEKGMVLLEYTGENPGKVSWYGPVTRTRYVFSAAHRVGYVDVRDAPDMLKMMDGREQAFHEYVAKPPVVAEEVVAEEAVAEATPIVTPERHIDDMRLVDLKEALADADAETVKTWLAQEEAGRQRAGILKALRAAQERMA